MEHPIRGESSTLNSMDPSKWKYDVFLSFAGKDTRLNFTDHLYDAFIRSGIRCFRDDLDLERGGHIKQDLFQAIQDSLCAVLIISENYADSTWCLDELQKIVDSRRRVFPIFYDIDPSDVRRQRKSFGEAMAKHEEKLLAGKSHEEKLIENTKKVQDWKNALFDIANLSGWDTRNKHEADVIQNIVGEVWTHLCSKFPCYDDNLVGIASRVGDMMQFLEIGLDDTRFVGIWGMGGVGKTTLARVVFHKLFDKFEVCCFLANVRETLKREGLVSLQKKLLTHLKRENMVIYDDYEGMKMIRKLLCCKKVLLIIDDLDDTSQLKNLAQSPNWFGKGSRIIITTRDSHLLTSVGAGRNIYEMKIMKEDESLQLLSNKAFRKDHPEESYLELSKSVVKFVGGLPLALEVLGSFLCGRSKAEWRDALDRLKKIPDKNILNTLKISYDGLNEEEKTMFLDIACFFGDWLTKREVTHIFECCDLHPTIGINVLIEKALLVETEYSILKMHDLLQDLGRYIVCQESPNDVGKHSRLWKLEDIKEVLENNKGSELIQGIVMPRYYQNANKIEVHVEAFSKMSNIRLLFLHTGQYGTLISPQGLKLSGALKVVLWPSFPLESLPLPLDKLAHIQFSCSKIRQLWDGIQFMNKLKSIDLSYSEDFSQTPDFSGAPHLEELWLQRCTSLVMVHPSLGELKKLVEVYLNGCENLEILPRKLETNSLIKLDLSGCKKVTVLPEFGKDMKKLSYLDMSRTAITRLPESLGSLSRLRHLKLSCCNIINLDKLLKTHVIRQIAGLNLTSLTELYLRGCGLNDGSMPNDFGSLSSLILLDLAGNNFVDLPIGCFSSLFHLLFLSLACCKRLKSLPRLPPRLVELAVTCCDSMEPLSDRQLWNLVASLDHERRGKVKYAISDEVYNDDSISMVPKDVEVECLPLRDFCTCIPGCEIPSWFHKKEYYHLDEIRGEYMMKLNKPYRRSFDERYECVIEVDVPPNFRNSEWCGIVVCLPITNFSSLITWSSKGAEDDDYIWKECPHQIVPADETGGLYIMVLEFNEKTCWQHLKGEGHNNSLHIKLSTYNQNAYGAMDKKIKAMGCGWRVICKEEIQENCSLNYLIKVIQPHNSASPDEVNLCWNVLGNFFGDVYENLLIQDMKKNAPE